jgi:hypothetical protein
MECTQVLDDINFGDTTSYKEGEKKQVIHITHYVLLMNNRVLKMKVGGYLWICFGRMVLQTRNTV